MICFSGWLILGFRVLAAEPRGTTIGPVSDSRLCLSFEAFGCCAGRHCPLAGTDESNRNRGAAPPAAANRAGLTLLASMAGIQGDEQIMGRTVEGSGSRLQE